MKSAGTEMLAIDGGAPARTEPLPPWPCFSEQEIDLATSILRSGRVNYWTGTECRQLEQEFADYHGVRHAVALANGTLALELALRVLDIGSGSEVIVTPRSYFASASAIVLSGATPVFADVDEDSQNVTVETLSQCLSEKTEALLVVHLAGWPCDMTAIMEFARQNDLKVIEDCAQAHGARHKGQLVGSFGDFGAFSFCQDKIMSSAGEGGMLITNDPGYWSAAWSFKDHGKSIERIRANDHAPGFRWLHHTFGSNWRMTEIQGAIARHQLTRLEPWVEARRRNAEQLASGLSSEPLLRIPVPGADDFHSYYKFYAFTRPERFKAGWSRDRMLAALEAEGVPGLSGSCPEIYREKAFSAYRHKKCEVAHQLGQTSLMFPVHPTMQRSDVDDLVTAVRKVCRAACI